MWKSAPAIFHHSFTLPVVIISALLTEFGGLSSCQSVQVTVFDETDFKGNSKDVTVERCVNILDFNDQASSIRTTDCVILYEDKCCQGNKLEVSADLASFDKDFDKELTSLSPCGAYKSSFPEDLKEKWLGHDQTMTKKAEDWDIAIYYNKDVKGAALQNHQDYIKRAWAYAKETYGDFGPEGGRVSAFFHSNVLGPQYGFNSIQNYFDIDSDCRNLVDYVSSSPDGWSKPLTGIELDIVTHEISHIVEGASKGLHGSPSYSFWKDSKWAEIFIYDVYNALEMIDERDRWFEQMQTSVDDFPKEDTYWFKDWFFPIYRDNGGAKLLNTYFEVLASNYPKEENGWEYVNRDMNLGEFVHFFSGAAGKDLQPQADIAFKWNDDAERQLQQAKKDFPDVYY